MALTDAGITTRRIAYRCCQADLGYAYIVDEALGCTDCAATKLKRMKFMRWAIGVMDRTPTSTESGGMHCVSHDFAEQVIQLADPGCAKCACPPITPPADPCAVTPDFTVDGVITEADLPSTPDGTYLVTNFGGSEVSIIGNVVGGGLNDPFIVPDGNIVLDSDTSVYYTSFQGVTTLLFPGITVGTFIAPFFFNVISDSAPYAYAQNRNIRIEATIDGTTWYTVYTGTEQSIAQQLTISTNVNPPIPSPTDFRIWYIEGSCEYGPVDASNFNTTPPFTNVVVGTTQFFPPIPGAPVFIYRGELYGTFTQVDSQVLPNDGGRFRTIRKADDSPDIMVAGAERGLLRRTADGGATWTTPLGNWASSPDIPDIDTAEMTKIQYVGSGVFFVAGVGGVLFVSSDYGQTFNWVEQTGLGGAAVRSVYAYSSFVIFVGTASDGVWRSDDAGTNWTKVLDIPDRVTHMEAVGNNLMAFISNPTSGCYRSTDAGLTWPAFPNTGIVDVNDTDVVGQTVYATGDKRYKSIDAGQTWIVQEAFPYSSVSAGSSQVVMYVGDNSEVFISFDGGVTVSPTSVGAASFYAWGLEFHIY